MHGALRRHPEVQLLERLAFGHRPLFVESVESLAKTSVERRPSRKQASFRLSSGQTFRLRAGGHRASL
jgi:hypothetical protein